MIVPVAKVESLELLLWQSVEACVCSCEKGWKVVYALVTKRGSFCVLLWQRVEAYVCSCGKGWKLVCAPVAKGWMLRATSPRPAG